MDLSKLKVRKAEEYSEIMWRDLWDESSGISREVYLQKRKINQSVTRADFSAGFTAAEELYRPLLEAVESVLPALEAANDAACVIQTVKDGNWEPEWGDYFDRLRALRHAMFCGKEINAARAALESFRKAGELPTIEEWRRTHREDVE